MNWYLDVLRKYAVFGGRARRKEYWMFVLFYFIFYIVLMILDRLLGLADSGAGLLTLLYSLALLIPSIAVGARRLHDTGRSGWWLLIGLIPLLGGLVLLFFFVQDSQAGSNEYGPNPKGA